MEEKQKIDLLIQQLESKLGLIYAEDSNSSPVCFRTNNQELRDDFKEVFCQEDLANFLRESKQVDSLEIDIPETAQAFWDLVQKGMRK